MTSSLLKQLTSFLLIVAVLLAPLYSFAHHLQSGAAKNTCACQLTLTDCASDESGDRPDRESPNNAFDCCDGEGCCQDAAESPVCCDLRGNVSWEQLFHINIQNHLPEVYLAIFVPPQIVPLT